MGDHDNPATCLSAFEHGSHVRDVVLHYFGCLRECERAKFFAPLPAYKKQRIREEEKRIRQQRALFEQDEETNLLVRKFKRSHNDFFKSRSEEMQKRIKDEEERLRNLPSILEVGTNDTPNSPESPNQQFSRQSTSSLDGGSNVTKPSKDNGFGFHAYAVFYRNSAPYDDSFCNDKFPNQRTPLKDLLYNKVKAVNPLMRDCEKDENEIRWFHFPGNNMEWVEVGELPYMPIADEATKLSFRKQLHVITTKIALSMMASSAGPRTLLRAICYCDLSSGEANSMADVTMPSTPDT
jgi:hypothetical protein